MKMPSWVKWYYFGLFILILIGAGFAWYVQQPPPQERWEMQGEFIKAEYAGSLNVGGGEEWNSWRFVVRVSQEEYDRVEATYKNIARKTYRYEISTNTVVYGRESTGNWCGELPPSGTLVKIRSTTGFTRNVRIKDLETGKVYRSAGQCLRPTYTYHFRVVERSSRKIIKEGRIVGPDMFQAMEDALLPYIYDNSLYIQQVWEEGDPTPELPK